MPQPLPCADVEKESAICIRPVKKNKTKTGKKGTVNSMRDGTLLGFTVLRFVLPYGKPQAVPPRKDTRDN